MMGMGTTAAASFLSAAQTAGTFLSDDDRSRIRFHSLHNLLSPLSLPPEEMTDQRQHQWHPKADERGSPIGCRHYDLMRRRKYSLSLGGLAIPVLIIFLCCKSLNLVPEVRTNLPSTRTQNVMSFAEAWLSPHNHPTRRISSAAVSALGRHRQSKLTRWYVHDDDTETADGKAIAMSPFPIETEPMPPINYRPKKMDLRILLIDNHDSYTYNLYQYISTMTVHPVEVIMNDAFSSYEDFVSSLESSNSLKNSTTHTNTTTTTATATTASLSEHFDCVVLSPGPGQPSRPADMGIVLETIRRNPKIPILGVCLGHQALGHTYGGEVKLSPCGPVHGLTSSVFHDEGRRAEETQHKGQGVQTLTCELFKDLPQNFEVVRYHSLVVDLPNESDELEIEPIAWCSPKPAETMDGPHASDRDVCMALRHKRYPHYGVQFHPESVGSGVAGYKLLWNFCEFAQRHKLQRDRNSERVRTTRKTEAKKSPNGEHFADPDLTNGVHFEHDKPSGPSIHRVLIHKIEKEAVASPLPLPKQVFEGLYSSRPNSFWLDSSTGEVKFVTELNADATNVPESDGKDEGCPIVTNSRFSIMGSNDGPLSRKVEYFGQEHDPARMGLRVINSAGEVESMADTDILSYLRRRLVEEREVVDGADLVHFDESMNGSSADPGYTLRSVDEFGEMSQVGAVGDQLPFDYRGGYVGYLGYEVRHDTQCWIYEQEGGSGCGMKSYSTVPEDRTNANVPTAAFLFVDRSLLYDHSTGNWYIIGVAKDNDQGDTDIDSNTDCKAGTSVEGTISWMQNIKSTIISMGRNTITTDAMTRANPKADDGVVFVPNRSKAQYQMDISRSHEEIRNGESYELCVTNQLEAEISLPKHSTRGYYESPFELYKLLREKNPAPFSAFMNLYEQDNLGMEASSALSICCSSPERFISVKKARIPRKVNGTMDNNKRPPPKRQFVVESKPIKGTAARYMGSSIDGVEETPELIKRVDSQIAAKLRKSVKDRAENLMIVDLLRNDLGRVCDVGSVHVPKLMHVESYATVHQMVSTIRGTLGDNVADKNVIDVVEACFPGGSMTGAPKQRTMEILEEIEEGVSRGPYSGCLGYVSLNGCMDMNIVIRSAILTPSMRKSDERETTSESWRASIGCGGAITALSDCDDEYEEMLLKSRVVRRAISDWVTQAMFERTQHIPCADDVGIS